MEAISMKDIQIKGEMAYRAVMNYARLEGEWYRPEEVFTADAHGWPADWEGRIILALCLLSKSTHRTPAYLDEIISLIPKHLNEKGYLGPILPEGQFDEQHMAGHSWFIRGLIEYYNLTGDDDVKAMIEVLVRNFLLPAKGKYMQYPLSQEERKDGGNGAWRLSKLQSKNKSHAQTSDAGCGFIMLDGATAAYDFLGWSELKELIEEMIERFQEIDFVNLHIQTHATLSATRGILKFYELTGESKYLELAVKMFDLYQEEAWSEAYGNYNWFGVPRWTEACAIIDSYILSVGLWKNTGKMKYLEDAHLIYYNAVCHAQRDNGAFGTDRCVGAKKSDDREYMSPITFEVYWCCSMRGGEAFARAIEHNFFTDKDEIYVPFYNSSDATLRFDEGLIKLRMKTEYPYSGHVEIEIVENTTGNSRQMKFFAPYWTKGKNVAVNVNGNMTETVYDDGFITMDTLLQAGDKISFDLGLSVRAENATHKHTVDGYHKFLFGPMLLGRKVDAQATEDAGKTNGNSVDDLDKSSYRATSLVDLARDTEFVQEFRGHFKAKDHDLTLSCLCNVENLTQKDMIRQVLFK